MDNNDSLEAKTTHELELGFELNEFAKKYPKEKFFLEKGKDCLEQKIKEQLEVLKGHEITDTELLGRFNRLSEFLIEHFGIDDLNPKISTTQFRRFNADIENRISGSFRSTKDYGKHYRKVQVLYLVIMELDLTEEFRPGITRSFFRQTNDNNNQGLINRYCERHKIAKKYHRDVAMIILNLLPFLVKIISRLINFGLSLNLISKYTKEHLYSLRSFVLKKNAQIKLEPSIISPNIQWRFNKLIRKSSKKLSSEEINSVCERYLNDLTKELDERSK